MQPQTSPQRRDWPDLLIGRPWTVGVHLTSLDGTDLDTTGYTGEITLRRNELVDTPDVTIPMSLADDPTTGVVKWGLNQTQTGLLLEGRYVQGTFVFDADGTPVIQGGLFFGRQKVRVP